MSPARRAFAVGWPLAFLWVANRHEPPKEDVPFRLREEEWRAKLTDAEYYVMRDFGTERAGSSPYDKLVRNAITSRVWIQAM